MTRNSSTLSLKVDTTEISSVLTIIGTGLTSIGEQLAALNGPPAPETPAARVAVVEPAPEPAVSEPKVSPSDNNDGTPVDGDSYTRDDVMEALTKVAEAKDRDASVAIMKKFAKGRAVLKNIPEDKFGELIAETETILAEAA